MSDLQLFTDDEIERLILVAVGAEGGATPKQIELFVSKCRGMKMQALLLNSLLSGSVHVSRFTEDDFVLKAQ